MSTTFEEILSYIKGTGSSDAPGGREAHKKLLGVEGLIIGPDLDIFTLGAEDGDGVHRFRDLEHKLVVRADATSPMSYLLQ